MRRAWWAVGMGAMLVAGCRVVGVEESTSIGVSHAYYVAPAPDSPAVLYFWARNPTTAGDSIIALRVDGADSAQVHGTMAMGNGMEHMMAVGEVPVPAHDTVRLAPGGLHGMVFGPPAGLRPGDSVQVTVGFLRTGEVSAWAQVISYAQVDSAVIRKQ